MKKIIVFLSLLGISLSANSFAIDADDLNVDENAEVFKTYSLEVVESLDHHQDGREENRRNHQRRNGQARQAFCPGLKLDENQKAKLKDAFLNARKSMIKAQAAIKLARLDYMAVLSDTNANSTLANTQADTLAKAMGSVPGIFLGLNNEIVFNILTVDQRKPGLRCMQMMKKKMMARKLKQACSRMGNRRPHHRNPHARKPHQRNPHQRHPHHQRPNRPGKPHHPGHPQQPGQPSQPNS